MATTLARRWTRLFPSVSGTAVLPTVAATSYRHNPVAQALTRPPLTATREFSAAAQPRSVMARIRNNNFATVVFDILQKPESFIHDQDSFILYLEYYCSITNDNFQPEILNKFAEFILNPKNQERLEQWLQPIEVGQPGIRTAVHNKDAFHECQNPAFYNLERMQQDITKLLPKLSSVSDHPHNTRRIVNLFKLHNFLEKVSGFNKNTDCSHVHNLLQRSVVQYKSVG